MRLFFWFCHMDRGRVLYLFKVKNNNNFFFDTHWYEKSNKRDTTDRAKRGVWDEKRGKERKKKKISIVFCT